MNAGLGNTTVTSSVSRGLMYDRTKAENALAEQIAQLKAGYMSQIGLAGLGYRGQAIQADTGVGLAQAGYQGSYSQALLGMAGGAMRSGGGGYGMGGGGTAQPMSQGSGLGGQGMGNYGPYTDPNQAYNNAAMLQYQQQLGRPYKSDPYIDTPYPSFGGGGGGIGSAIGGMVSGVGGMVGGYLSNAIGQIGGGGGGTDWTGIANAYGYGAAPAGSELNAN